jgi:adenylate cyclase
MTDLRGFTTLVKTIAPHQVMQLLADYQSRMVPRILEHSGCIDKFLGDGILAHFGAAVTSSTYAADALYAAEALARNALLWQEERRQQDLPPVCMGVACAADELIFGAVGDEDRLEFTIVGDAVNLTAKLEKHTKMAKVNILTTKELYSLALKQGYKSQFTTVYLPQETVEGVATPLDLVGLKGA